MVVGKRAHLDARSHPLRRFILGHMGEAATER